MAVTVINNLNLWSAADSNTGWVSDGDSIASYSGFQREGSANLGIQISQTQSHVYLPTGSGDAPVSSKDLSNLRIYAWVFVWGSLDTKANGGLRIVLGDGTNRRAYYVGGSDDYGFQVGGWTCIVLDTGNLPSGFAQLAGSGAPTLTAITQVGVGANFLNKATGNVDNFYWDVVRFGLGITVYGGTAGGPGTFAEIAADDASTASGKAYGIIRELQAGVYGVQGDILFGDQASTNGMFFKDAGTVVVIEDRVHGSGTPTAIQIHVRANATATDQHFELGTAVGSGDTQKGRNGVSFLNANLTQPVDFDASDADLHEFLAYGCTWDGIDSGTNPSVTLSSDATLGPDHRLSGCTFARCGQVDIGRVVARNCVWSGYTSDSDGALLWNENIDIKNSQFIANTDGTNDPAAIEHPSNAGSPYTYDNLTFSGNDFDVNNTSGSAITINLNNGSDGSSSKGSSVTFAATVPLTVTVKNQNGDALQGIRVRYEQSDGTLISNGETNASGVFTFSENVSALPYTNARIIIRKKAFEDFETTLDIPTTGFDIPVALQPDFDVNLP